MSAPETLIKKRREVAVRQRRQEKITARLARRKAKRFRVKGRSALPAPSVAVGNC
jgi:hypothetical protein